MFLSPCESCPLASATRPCISGEFRAFREGQWWATSPNPSPAPVMVLGAAGGWQEEQQGRPFVGPSGGELMNALTKAGMAEMYLTNSAKCIPLDHGEPIHAAVKACKSRLEEEIRAVGAKFILCLGNVALQSVLGRGTITSMAGKEIWSNKYSCWLLPAFHPSFILRSPGRRSGWVLDLLRYGQLVRGEIPLPGKPPVRVFTLGDLGWM